MTAPRRRRAAIATFAGTGSSVAITILQAFVLIPLCLAHLGADLYGGWLAASELLIWVQLLDMGIPNLITQRIGAAFGRRDRTESARWAFTGLAILCMVGVGLGFVAIIAAPLVTGWARVAPAHVDAFTSSFRIGAIASALLLASNGVFGISRGVQMTTLMSAVQVGAAISGLSLSVGLLLAGFGVRALALGLLGRAVVSVGGSVWFILALRRSGVPIVRPSAAVMRETAGLAPAMAAGSFGYVVANYSEILLVNSLFGPTTATVYTLTRRAIDALRTLLDSFAWAVYGGFSHLVSGVDRARARTVLHDVLDLRLAVACVCGAIAAAVNRPFVVLLFGSEQFGGMWLTTAFVAHMVIGGQAFLVNYLLRATGRVREGSFALAYEAVVRVAAMAGGLLVFGLAGAPALATVISAALLVVMMRWLDRELPGGSEPVRSNTPFRIGLLAVVALGPVVGSVSVPVSWPMLVATACGVLAAGSGLLLVTHPMTRAHTARLAGGVRFVAENVSDPAVVSVGTLVPDEPRFHGPAFSRAVQMYHEGLLTGLAEAGLRADVILSVEPMPAFPRDRRLLARPGAFATRNGWTVRLLPFINVHPVKWFSAGLVVLAALVRWSWRHRGRPRIIHCINLSMPPGIFIWIAARLTGSCLVASVLDVFRPGTLVADTLYRRLDFAMQRWLIPRADGLMVVSDAIAADFAPGRHVCRIDGGLMPESFAPRHENSEGSRHPALFTVVLAGSLEPYNGVDVALAAAALLPEGIELVFAGGGSCAERVREHAACNRRIRYLGLLTFADVLALYASADLLLNPRLTRAVDTRYFFPSKLMELLASGTPVLSTATGHVEEEYGHVLQILRDETPEALASAIVSMASLPADERRALGARARAFMQAEKTWTRQGTRLAAYIRQVLRR